jgi:hypothetical protein
MAWWHYDMEKTDSCSINSMESSSAIGIQPTIGMDTLTDNQRSTMFIAMCITENIDMLCNNKNTLQPIISSHQHNLHLH